MKKILAAAAAFTLILTAQSCSYGENTEISEPSETTAVTTVSETETTTTVSASVTSTVCTTVTTVTSVSETAASTEDPTIAADYDSVELSMLDNAGSPDYHAEAAIPYVAWTEINLNKTMYATSRCIGYEFAMPDAAKKMIYDAGIALDVIARTSTGYYRIDGDYYIPCEFLDNTPPDDADPSVATSCTVPPPPVVTAAKPAVTAIKKQ